MKGFDLKFHDFPDYILGITKQIWEDRGLATLHDYYANDILVRSPGSIVRGNQGVIAATAATLAEFPDRRLLGEDVIWSGTDEVGMLSSHRILSTATHSNSGVYGDATGRKLQYRIMADCHAINNQINDEWLIRDQGAIVRQLGWEPCEYARNLIEREGGSQTCVQPYLPENDIEGPYKGRGNDNDWGHRLADVLRRIMAADFAVIPKSYDRAASLFYPGGQETHSHDGADRFWMGLRASFPNAKFSIHHQIGREDPMMPPRAAIRWSLDGLHEGWGAFGQPTHKRVHIMGITQVEFGPYGEGDATIRREYTLFDETTIWKQIYMQEG